MSNFAALMAEAVTLIVAAVQPNRNHSFRLLIIGVDS
jgi:hypothetical protein